MAHLLILCEGDLEGRKLELFLKPYWTVRFETCEVQQYSGVGELKKEFKADAERQLKSEPDSAVLCVFDLYEEPFELHQKGRMSPDEGYTVVQQRLYTAIDSRLHPRFGGFPVVMETETWLLASPKVQAHLGCGFIAAPETELHPSAFIKHHYKGKYNKLQSGINLFDRAEAKAVYEDNCPHFNELIDWLTAGRMPPRIAMPVATSLPAATVAHRKAVWEAERDRLYEAFQQLETLATSDEALDAAIIAEGIYNDHYNTYSEIFDV
jgi:hypothetical protein